MYDLAKKILIVEDDGMLRNLLIDSFNQFYSVLDAADGEMALQKISFHQPDLVLLDLLLPKTSGFEVLKKIRQDPNPRIASTPVIVISNLSDNASVKAARDLKVDDY